LYSELLKQPGNYLKHTITNEKAENRNE